MHFNIVLSYNWQLWVLRPAWKKLLYNCIHVIIMAWTMM